MGEPSGQTETFIEPQVSMKHDGVVPTPHKRSIRVLGPGSDGKHIVTASADGVLCTWNASSGSLLSSDSVISKYCNRIAGKEERLTDVAFLPLSNRSAMFPVVVLPRCPSLKFLRISRVS
jgi:WD40 repeat protein